MRYAVISDVHANLEALEVVLADVDTRRPDALVCLGDFVGYGPDPVACVERLRPRLAGAVVGNHDRAALDRLDISVFNPYAQAAILWTREQLTDGVRRYLADLPEDLRQNAFLAVHGSPRDPIEEYVLDGGTASAGFEAAEFHLCLIGHSHVPGMFVHDGERVSNAALVPNEAVQLTPTHRYMINVGSVGQPRDGDPRAAYLVLDEDASAATLVRLPYPLQKTQEKMQAAGLPSILAERLAFGR